jgi:anti-sigma factor RsiW
MSKTLDDGELENNRRVTEEEIMAYADGVLPPARRAAVRQALTSDPAQMLVLESYLGTHSHSRLKQALEPVFAAPIPGRVLAKLRLPTAEPPSGSRLTAFFRSAGLHLFGRYSMPVLAMAALCLMLLGAWLGNYALQYLAPASIEFAQMDERGLVALPALQQALESTPSGEAAALSERLAIRPTATLRSRQGTWCRQFDLLYGSGQRGRALACRSGDGSWLVPVTTVPQGSAYGVAGGPQPSIPSEKSASDDSAAIMDGARQRISSDPVVSPEKERGLIEDRWRQKL